MFLLLGIVGHDVKFIQRFLSLNLRHLILAIKHIISYCGSFKTSIFTCSQHFSITIVHLLVLVLIPISTSLASSINLTATMLTPGATSGPVVTSSATKSKRLEINCED